MSVNPVTIPPTPPGSNDESVDESTSSNATTNGNESNDERKEVVNGESHGGDELFVPESPLGSELNDEKYNDELRIWKKKLAYLRLLHY